MDQTFKLKPIGTIYTPYHDLDDTPRQGIYAADREGIIKIFEAYKEGLKDLKRFSQVILIFYFHKNNEERLTATPPKDYKERGVYSTRAPHRPNHLGLTIVKIKEIRKNQLIVEGVDMLNGTPLLDIKPYIKELDSRNDE